MIHKICKIPVYFAILLYGWYAAKQATLNNKGKNSRSSLNLPNVRQPATQQNARTLKDLVSSKYKENHQTNTSHHANHTRICRDMHMHRHAYACTQRHKHACKHTSAHTKAKESQLPSHHTCLPVPAGGMELP